MSAIRISRRRCQEIERREKTMRRSEVCHQMQTTTSIQGNKFEIRTPHSGISTKFNQVDVCIPIFGRRDKSGFRSIRRYAPFAFRYVQGESVIFASVASRKPADL